MTLSPSSPRTSPSSVGPVGVAFGSGGARGLAHLGVLQALEELGLVPGVVAGTSIGAIAAAAYATGTVRTVRESFLAMGVLEVSRMFLDIGLPRSGLIDGHHVMEKLGTWIPDIDIGHLRIPFAAVATDIGTQSEVVLGSGSVLDAIRASISIPGVFTPVRHGDAWLVDGGLVDPLPVSVARGLGARRVLAVDINLTSGAEPAPDAGPSVGPTALDRLKKAFAGDAPFIGDVMTRALRAGENAIERERLAGDAPDFVLSPPVGHIPTLDFRNAETVLRAGYECAMGQADALRALWSPGRT